MGEIEQPEAEEVNKTTYVFYIKLKPAQWLRSKTAFPKDPILVSEPMSSDSQGPITLAPWNLMPSCGPQRYQQTHGKHPPSHTHIHPHPIKIHL